MLLPVDLHGSDTGSANDEIAEAFKVTFKGQTANGVGRIAFNYQKTMDNGETRLTLGRPECQLNVAFDK